jgi:hypothetical protein
MSPGKTLAAAVVGTALAVIGYGVSAQHQHPSHGAPATPPDNRVLVKLPDQLRIHTMSNMRDHLLALSQIQDALARESFDEAGKIAEERLGMTSLVAHGAHEVAKYMPQGMQDAGTAMHHGASRFALELQKTAVTGDLKPALAALARTTDACVACHAGYRFQ